MDVVLVRSMLGGMLLVLFFVRLMVHICLISFSLHLLMESKLWVCLMIL